LFSSPRTACILGQGFRDYHAAPKNTEGKERSPCDTATHASQQQNAEVVPGTWNADCGLIGAHWFLFRRAADVCTDDVHPIGKGLLTAVTISLYEWRSAVRLKESTGSGA
jgi:hypothetical protein